MSALNNETAVKTQYASSANLSTRISIHAKYSTNKQGFGNWIAAHYPVFAGMSVLELGCGTGAAWLNQREIIDACSRITLTDFSELWRFTFGWGAFFVVDFGRFSCYN